MAGTRGEGGNVQVVRTGSDYLIQTDAGSVSSGEQRDTFRL